MARPLTNRERKLAIAFGAALFLLANLVGVTALMRKQAGLQADLETLRAQRGVAENRLADKEMWRQRGQWLDKNQPVMKTEGQADAELLESLTTSAAQHSITVVSQKFTEEPDSKHKMPFQQIGVTLTVTGSLEAITRWLAEVQQPEKFQAVPMLSMRLDNDPSKYICDLTVARYYAPGR